MRRLSAVIGAIVLALSPFVVHAQNINQPVSMYPAPAFEYVQQAVSLESDGKTMTLKGVPSTVFFSDRPYRLTGHMDNAAFAKLWQGPNGPFASIVPNAAVSVLGDTQNPPAIVELTSAEVTGDSLKYGIQVLSGKVPESAESVALFVDHASRVHSTAASGYHAYPYHPVPGPYCYHSPQAPECHYHPYHPYYPPYPPYYHPGAAFAAGAAVGAAAASANQPQYVYPIPTGPIPAQCYINSNHTRMICSVPIQQ